MFNNLKKEKLLVISNISVMTLTFLILGLFISIVALSQTALRNLEKQAQITLFFKDDFPEPNILELQTKLEADTRVSAIKYVSKEDAFVLFTELNKDDPILLESISASILPASLEIRTRKLDELPVLAEELSTIDGVEEVKYFKDVIEAFRFWSGIAYTVGFTMVAAFILISFTVIMITLRLTINSKGTELEILKLVGASNEYVKRPLIKQSVTFGIVSALIASSILFLLAIMLQLTGAFTGKIALGFLPDVLISTTVFTLLLSFVLIASGFTLGYFGSITAIRKYLNY